MTKTLEQHLDAMGEQFDEKAGLRGAECHHPGYHTALPQGTYVHDTRGNFEYATLLLRSDRAEDHQRADGVLRELLKSQETDPTEPTFGIWPWYADEPLPEMDKPDWNWADFCGALIATILIENPDRLPDSTVTQLRAALDRAAMSIFRRNVAPSYTNIAIMGAAVTAMAGEILEEPRWLDYGRRRLERFVEYTTHHGGLNEYNSPTYTFVALHECERVLQLVRDVSMRETAEKLRRMIWEFLSERFHPATGQMAGPHSRAYADWLSPANASELAMATGVHISGAEDTGQDDPRMSVVKHLPCPEDIRPRFESLPSDPMEVRGRFIRRDPDAASTFGHTWLSREACLGSVNCDCLWVQRRPLIGYIATGADRPGVLKALFLRDGKPCAAASIHNVQDGTRILSAFGILTDRGDHHLSMDHPKDAVYSGSDLRIRFELTGEGASVERPDSEQAILSIAGWRAVIHTGPAFFDGVACEWECVETEEGVAVDAVLAKSSEPTQWPFLELGASYVVTGLELLAPDTDPLGSHPESREEGEAVVCRWGELELRAPIGPHTSDVFLV